MGGSRHGRGRRARSGAGRRGSGRKYYTTAAGVTLVGTVVAIVAVGTSGGSASEGSRRTTPAGAANAPMASPAETSSPVQGDHPVIAYYKANAPSEAGHVKKVDWTGPYLRVYTDLPDSKADSKVARSLCEVAAHYLEKRQRDPIVFIHAEETSNGYSVIANKLSLHDGCELNAVP